MTIKTTVFHLKVLYGLLKQTIDDGEFVDPNYVTAIETALRFIKNVESTDKARKKARGTLQKMQNKILYIEGEK